MTFADIHNHILFGVDDGAKNDAEMYQLIDASYADVTKANTVLGWRAERNVVDACRDTWNWQKNNPNGYEE